MYDRRGRSHDDDAPSPSPPGTAAAATPPPPRSRNRSSDARGALRRLDRATLPERVADRHPELHRARQQGGRHVSRRQQSRRQVANDHPHPASTGHSHMHRPAGKLRLYAQFTGGKSNVGGVRVSIGSASTLLAAQLALNSLTFNVYRYRKCSCIVLYCRNKFILLHRSKALGGAVNLRQ